MHMHKLKSIFCNVNIIADSLARFFKICCSVKCVKKFINDNERFAARSKYKLLAEEIFKVNTLKIKGAISLTNISC